MATLSRVLIWGPIALIALWIAAALIPKSYSVYVTNETKRQVVALTIVGTDNRTYVTDLPASKTVVIRLDAKAGEGPVHLSSIGGQRVDITVNPGPAFDSGDGVACIYVKQESVEYFDENRERRGEKRLVTPLEGHAALNTTVSPAFAVVTESPCRR